MQNRLLLLGILFSSFLSVNSQELIQGNTASKKYKGTDLIRTCKYSSNPSFVHFQKGKEIDFDNWQNWIQLNFNPKGSSANSYSNFKFINKQTDKLGQIHYRFQQLFNGFPLENGIWLIHTKDGKVLSMNGLLYNKIDNSSPSLSEADALAKALLYVNAQKYKWEIPSEELFIKESTKDISATYFPKGQLVYASKSNDYSNQNIHLTYKFNIYAQTPLSRADIYVDAITGEIILENKLLMDADVLGSAVTAYSGTQPITTDSFGGSYRLRETGRGNGINTYNMLTGTTYGSAVDFTDLDNVWNNVNPAQDEVATDAHFGAEMTYDYYLLNHSRNSIDDAGFALNSYVHYDVAYNNAFWDGTQMTYGDGDGTTFNPFTALDIAGHEITHGLTTFSANLAYSDESGALNESFSDIFGASIEFWATPLVSDWLMGEDIGTVIRNMADPNSMGDPDTYFGTNWAPLGGGDNGGVHTNSGVQNYWYYLLSTGGTGVNDNSDAYSVTGIGITSASDIAFRNLTVYLTSSSQYDDARFYAIQSAIDLFGPCTSQVQATTDAWYAVGVGTPYVAAVTSNFSASATSFCSAPVSVDFSNLSNNASTFTWDFGDGATSTANSPTHVYNALGTYTVQLIADGGSCGIDTLVLTNYIIIDTSIACNVNLPTNGTGITQTSCDGNLFDSGGPSANYGGNEDAQITISPLGAVTVDLNFILFDVEPGTGTSCNYDWVKLYDGPSTASTLIGTYCNNNIPTTVSSTGGSITLQFHSDGGLELPGFQVSWNCNLATVPPVANFTSNTVNTCNGDVQFTDLSTNAPTSWAWDFGDGGTSTMQNPNYTYTVNGTYTVTLTATNGIGSDGITQINYIVVNRPPAPIGNDTSICANNSVLLNAIGSGTLYWYNAPVAGTLVNTGSSFLTPILTYSITYYVEEAVPAIPQNVGPLDNTIGGGGYFSGDQHLEFDCINPFTLNSVNVFAGSAGNRTIELRDNTGTVIQSTIVNIPSGASTVTLNFNVPIGLQHQLGVLAGSAPNLYRNNTGAAYPYTIPGLVSITGSSAASTAYYYFFYDWEVQEPGCSSLRVPITVTVDTINDPTITDITSPICSTVATLPMMAATGGGVWSSTCGCINPTTGLFLPSTAGVGLWTVSYTTSGACASTDTTIVNVQDCSGIVEIEKPFSVTIVPNPADENILISLLNANYSNFSFSIQNSLGQNVVLGKENYEGKAISVNVGNLNAGVYFVTVECGNSKSVNKLIVK